MYYLWLPLPIMTELSGHNRDSMDGKTENIYYLALYRKSLPILSYTTCNMTAPEHAVPKSGWNRELNMKCQYNSSSKQVTKSKVF